MKLSSRRVCGLSMAVLALISFTVCGGGKSPSGQTPVPSPTPNPGPTPTPAPTAEPPLSRSCERIGWGGEAKRCPMEQSGFQSQVDDAIRTLQRERPDMFSGNQVLSQGAFVVGLIKILDRDGICAGWDGEELGVKTNNEFNEQFDILTSNGLARFGPVSYRTTCYPAAFPIQPGPPIPAPPGCNLPPSEVLACGREPFGKYFIDVNAAIGDVLLEHPDLFDPLDTRGEAWPYIKNLEAYANFVAEALTKRGYCARWDGKELQVKKGTNEFNEQYAITLSLTHVRRDPNSYRSSCYPAAF